METNNQPDSLLALCKQLGAYNFSLEKVLHALAKDSTNEDLINLKNDLCAELNRTAKSLYEANGMLSKPSNLICGDGGCEKSLETGESTTTTQNIGQNTFTNNTGFPSNQCPLCKVAKISSGQSPVEGRVVPSCSKTIPLNTDARVKQLKEYRFSLQRITEALSNDPTNEDLLTLKKDLVEVINLTEKALANNSDDTDFMNCAAYSSQSQLLGKPPKMESFKIPTLPIGIIQQTEIETTVIANINSTQNPNRAQAQINQYSNVTHCYQVTNDQILNDFLEMRVSGMNKSVLNQISRRRKRIRIKAFNEERAARGEPPIPFRYIPQHIMEKIKQRKMTQ